ncbi:MAG: xanthine dehydrogenase family protein [Bradyrhizobiaceae bacterium]|nr:xanthine dehydrogenase family protein [Bradyrhizobiaceae bacterium]
MSSIDDGEKFALGTEGEQRPWQDAYRALVQSFEAGSGRRYVGHSVPRNDVLYKVRGKAKYAANIALPDMLHGRFVRSTYPYARIKRVDVSKASALPGVRCVLTAADIPDDRLKVGSLVKDTPILAKDLVRHVGEPVVAIAADTLEIAHAAAALVEIDYEPITPVLTPEEALKEDAPRLHPNGNLIANLSNAVGDVDAALARADVVLEDTYTNEPIEHSYLEPQGGISFIDPDGVLTLLVCTQYPHFHHKQLADVTGLPLEKIRVIQTVIGGAFGGKIDVTIECASCLMTLKTRRPVKMLLENEEVFSATTKRHTMKIRHRLGAMKDGRIVALDMDILADGGAYSSYSLIVAGRCVVHAALPYDIANVRARIRTTFTNNMTAGAMRSFGIVKLAFATESQINKLADELGMSPIEVRRINAVETGTKTVTGQILHAVGFKKTLDAIEPIYEERKKALAAGPKKPGVLRGLGLASLGYGIGYSGVRNPSTARIELTEDGIVIANCGTPDIGPGSDTALAQIVGEEAGVNIGRIRVVSGDSTKTDDSGPTSASRTTYFSGNAAMLAGRDFRRQFSDLLAKKLDVTPENIRIDNDQVIVNNKPMRFEDACATLGSDVKQIMAYGVFNPDSELDFVTFKGNPYPTYTYATQLAEIEVDIDTGKIEVPRFWAAHDAGRIVNPMGAEGQIEGGVVMGLGMALWEKICRSDGYIQNPGMRDYLLPGAKDAPTEITTIFIDNEDETGPFGAKGVAEASLIPVPAAVAAALHDAAGIRLNAMPMEAETVVKKLAARKGNKP